MFPGFQLNGALGVRPARSSDEPFLAALYRASRDDLRLLELDEEVVEGLIDWQRHCQTQGYGDMFPNALYFIVEVQGERAGRLVVDFGPNEIRVIDILFLPQARGKGYGTQLLQGLQQAAATVRAPLALTVASQNVSAKRLYGLLGFRTLETQSGFERMCWFPTGGRPKVGI